MFKLNLSGVGSGGGWGLGEQYSQLPPAEKQLKSFKTDAIFKVKQTDDVAHSSDDEGSARSDSKPPAIDETPPPKDDRRESLPGLTVTEASLVANDKQHRAGVSPQQDRPGHNDPHLVPSGVSDTDTIVDHGSDLDNPAPTMANNDNSQQGGSSAVVASNPFAMAKSPPPGQVKPPPLTALGLQNIQEVGSSGDDEEQFWEPGEIVSRTELDGPVKAMLIDGKDLWVAVGDNDIQSYSLSGPNLRKSHTIAGVKSVRSMAVIPPPPAVKKPAAKKPTYPAAKPQPIKEADGPMLWCGLENGNIAVCNLFFHHQERIIERAHTSRISFMLPVPGPRGTTRVWTANEMENKYLQVWDPTRSSPIQKHPIEAPITNACFVPAQGDNGKPTVWLSSHFESRYRIADLDGRTIKPSAKLQGKGVHDMKYHAETKTVWLCIDSQIVIVNAQTQAITHRVGVTAPVLEFLGDLAVIVAYGDEMGSNLEHIAGVRVRKNEKMQITFRGKPLSGISSTGIKCVSKSLQLCVGAQRLEEGANPGRYLTVFTTQQTAVMENWEMGEIALQQVKKGRTPTKDTKEGGHHLPGQRSRGQSITGQKGAAAPKEEASTPVGAVESGRLASAVSSATELSHHAIESASRVPTAQLDLRSQSNVDLDKDGQPRSPLTRTASERKESRIEVNRMQQQLNDLQRGVTQLLSGNAVRDDFAVLYSWAQSIAALKTPQLSDSDAMSTTSDLPAFIEALTAEEKRDATSKMQTDGGRLVAIVLSSLLKTAQTAALDDGIEDSGRERKVTGFGEVPGALGRRERVESKVTEAAVMRVLQSQAESAKEERQRHQREMAALRRQYDALAAKNDALRNGLVRVADDVKLKVSSFQLDPTKSDLVPSAQQLDEITRSHSPEDINQHVGKLRRLVGDVIAQASSTAPPIHHEAGMLSSDSSRYHDNTTPRSNRGNISARSGARTPDNRVTKSGPVTKSFTNVRTLSSNNSRPSFALSIQSMSITRRRRVLQDVVMPKVTKIEEFRGSVAMRIRRERQQRGQRVTTIGSHMSELAAAHGGPLTPRTSLAELVDLYRSDVFLVTEFADMRIVEDMLKMCEVESLSVVLEGIMSEMTLSCRNELDSADTLGSGSLGITNAGPFTSPFSGGLQNDRATPVGDVNSTRSSLVGEPRPTPQANSATTQLLNEADGIDKRLNDVAMELEDSAASMRESVSNLILRVAAADETPGRPLSREDMMYATSFPRNPIRVGEAKLRGLLHWCQVWYHTVCRAIDIAEKILQGNDLSDDHQSEVCLTLGHWQECNEYIHTLVKDIKEALSRQDDPTSKTGGPYHRRESSLGNVTFHSEDGEYQLNSGSSHPAASSVTAMAFMLYFEIVSKGKTLSEASALEKIPLLDPSANLRPTEEDASHRVPDSEVLDTISDTISRLENLYKPVSDAVKALHKSVENFPTDRKRRASGLQAKITHFARID